MRLTWKNPAKSTTVIRRIPDKSCLKNGLACERYIDTYDTQPWAYQLEGYRDGSLISRNYYNADGSLFA